MMYRIEASNKAPIPGVSVSTTLGQVREYTVTLHIPGTEAATIPGAEPVYKHEAEKAETEWIAANAERIIGAKPALVYEWYCEAYPESMLVRKQTLDSQIRQQLGVKPKTIRITQYTIRAYCRE